MQNAVKGLAVWVGCAALLAGGIYACSGTSTDDSGGGSDASVSHDDGSSSSGDDGGGGGGGDDGGGGGGGKDSSTPTDGGSDGGLTQADLACIQSADASACDPCCNAAHNGGGDKFVDYQLACACEPTRCDQTGKKAPPYGGCNTSICKDGGGAPSATCNKCIVYEFSDQDGSAGDAGCLPVVFGQCEQNADCLGYLKCAVNCP